MVDEVFPSYEGGKSPLWLLAGHEWSLMPTKLWTGKFWIQRELGFALPQRRSVKERTQVCCKYQNWNTRIKAELLHSLQLQPIVSEKWEAAVFSYRVFLKGIAFNSQLSYRLKQNNITIMWIHIQIQLFI